MVLDTIIRMDATTGVTLVTSLWGKWPRLYRFAGSSLFIVALAGLYVGQSASQMVGAVVGRVNPSVADALAGYRSWFMSGGALAEGLALVLVSGAAVSVFYTVAHHLRQYPHGFDGATAYPSFAVAVAMLSDYRLGNTTAAVAPLVFWAVGWVWCLVAGACARTLEMTRWYPIVWLVNLAFLAPAVVLHLMVSSTVSTRGAEARPSA